MNASDPQIRSAIAQVAADWYAAHRVGLLSETERAAFLAWLKASPIHIEEFLGVAALERALGAATAEPWMSADAWVEMARADPTCGIFDITGHAVSDEPPPVSPARRFWRRIGAIAGLSVAVIGVLWVVRGSDGF